MKKKKGGLGGLYVMIALCLVCSVVAVMGLMGKLEGYKESDDSYANLQNAAFSILPEEGQNAPATPVVGNAIGGNAASQQPAQNVTVTAAPVSATNGSESLSVALGSEDEYQLGQDAQTGETTPSAAIEDDVYDPYAYEPEEGEPEGENVVDEALFWMLENQSEDELITGWPLAEATPAPVDDQQGQQSAGQQSAPAANASQSNEGQTPAVPVTQPEGQPFTTATNATQSSEELPPAAPVTQSAGQQPAGQPSAGQQSTPATNATQNTEEMPPAAPVTQPAGQQPAGQPSAGQQSTPATNATQSNEGLPPDAPVITPEPTATPEPTPEPTPTVPPYIPSSGISMERAVTVTSARYAVNFDYLTLVNDEVVGWLYQEGTPINYPVLRGEDNAFYLNHLFDGTVNSAGSIFMDCGNSAAFIDSATYLYGHHSKGGGMFASLSEYLNQEYYDAHPQLLLMTPFADYQVDLFAGITTVVQDESTWRLKDLETEEDLNAFVDSVRSQSFFAAPEDTMPEWGDRLLVLVTCTNIETGQRYVIYGRMRPIVYETDEESVVATKVSMDEKPTMNKYVEIEGVGEFMLYAQNDPLWSNMVYESKGAPRRRKFGDGGCSPTAVAIAIANLCPEEQLTNLIGYANTALGYTFCDCSVNRFYCNHTHAQYQLRTPEEFLRYFPVAIANFATGNNIWDMKPRSSSQGTSMRYLEKICAIYGIRVSVIKEVDELKRRMDEEKIDGIDRMAICCAIHGSPFTNSGHFMVIPALDDEYMYFLDPLRRDSYEKYDRKGYAEVLEPGVARVKMTDVPNCLITPFYLLEKVQ